MNQSLHFQKNNNKSVWVFFAFALIIHSFILIFNIESRIDTSEVSLEAKKIKLKMKQIIVNNQISNEKTEPEVDKEQKKESSFLSQENATFKEQTKAKESALSVQSSIGKVSAKDLLDQFSKKSTTKAEKAGTFTFSPEIDLAKNPSLEQKVKKGNNSNSKIQASSSTEIFDDLKVADFTKVNTIKYKYYGYYKRVRAVLEKNWGKNLKEAFRTLYYKNSRVPASQSYITQLLIKMDSLGVIEKIAIKGESGIKDFDLAAIKAFNQAGSFPNPPKDLVKNGQILLDWGFILKN